MLFEHNAFAMVSSLSRTPARLKTMGGDKQGFAVIAGRNTRHRELWVLISNYEISPSNMGPIPGGNDTEIFVPGLGLLGIMTSLDRLTNTYEDTNGYDLEIKNIPRSWGDLTVEQYRIDHDNNMELVDSWTVKKKCRFRKSVWILGDWVHSDPDPELNPDGTAQGIDMIVVYGDNKPHCSKH